MKVEEYLTQYLHNYQNYKDNWNYEDGCVLIGAKQMYEATDNDQYRQFIEHYLQQFIQEDGTIDRYELKSFNIDSINCSKILFFMEEQTAAEKYRKAIEFTMDQLKKHPRCQCGNFWHKEIYPNQIWLDGLYMAQPFYMEYETKYGNKENYGDIIEQFKNVQKYLYCAEKELCYHAYDEARIQFWCDQETGCSKNFWLRSMGWYLMGLVDVMEAMDVQLFEFYQELAQIFKTLVKGILRYQDHDTGLFLQVIDKPEATGNYLETSGSAMIAYAMMKACRMGILSMEKYADQGIAIIDAIISHQLNQRTDDWHLDGICHVAGLGPETSPWRDGTIEYYLSEKIVSDDAKGVGPFMMAYAQKLQLEKEMIQNGYR